MDTIRTRFAPSPTGYMHVGGVRTALFAWLTARQSGGQFILRIEDTDKAREVEGSEAHIIKSLKWLGLDWDEGTDIGGPYGPYLQSNRLEIYREWALKLVKAGKAYADPYSKEEVDEFHQAAMAAKKPFLFRDYRPDNPPEWDGSQPLRLKSEPQSYSWHDLVMGDLKSGPEVIDDFILMKADGYPTYNFGHIVDDFLMQITHIIRGQEFISSVPKFLSLYEALDITPPIMAHLPPILAPDGRRKLGKRDGAKDILAYASEGYLPETMINFLASLGWNDGTEQEIFSRQEIIEKFSLNRVQKSGARFDEQRLTWMNGYYIRQLDNATLYKQAKDYWPTEASNYDDIYVFKVLSVIKERLKYFSEIPELTSFFFSQPEPNLELINNNKQLQSFDKAQLKNFLTTVIQSFSASDFSLNDLSERLNNLLLTTGQKPGVLFSLIRITTTWAPASPSLAESLEILGKAVVLDRLNQAFQII